MVLVSTNQPTKMTIVREAVEIYDLQCHICEEKFRNPKVLPCLHSFCQRCLEDTINEGRITCPTCKTYVPIPTKGVEALPVSSFVSNILNILAVQSSSSTCTNCEEGGELAAARCLDCVENLCEACVAAHERIRQTRSHRILTFEELQNNTVGDTLKCPSFCKLHDREILKYFCETCNNAICRDCAIYEHRDHDYRELKEAVNVHSIEVNQLLNTTKQKIPVLKEALCKLTKLSDSLENRENAVEGLINKTIDAHIQRLEERRKALISQVKGMVSKKNEVLEEQYARLEFDLNNIKSSCDFVENIFWYGNEAEFMDVKNMMVPRLEELSTHQSQMNPEENAELKFLRNDQTLMVAIDDFGFLTTSDAFAPFCKQNKKANCLMAKVGHESSFEIILKDRFDQQISKGGDEITVVLVDADGNEVPTDVIDNNDGSYIVQYTIYSKYDHLLSVYIYNQQICGSPFHIKVSKGIDTDRIGPLLTKFGSTGVTTQNIEPLENYEPWGVVCDANEHLIVTDHSNHKIQKFDKNGKLLAQFGTRGKNEGEIWYPTGVTVDKSNNIYVADHGNHRIQVFDEQGNFLLRIGSRGNVDGLLKCPCGITVDFLNRLIVADRDNHRVQIFSLEGKLLFIIGSYGCVEGKFDTPRHVCVTSENHILVSDSNNSRIQRFDQFGNYISVLGSKGNSEGQFQCPSGICTDSEDNLIVADFKNLNLQIFNSNGNQIKKITDPTLQLLQKPTGVCVSRSGNLVVTDRGSHKILLF